MSTLYKVYTEVLANRIKEDSEKVNAIPHQTGFRKGMGTMDNIYVLNYLVNRLGKGKKVVALFVALRATFDTIDRKVLCKTMEERGIREGLIERVREMLRETRSRVKVGEMEVERSFWTARGVRQGYPVSPLLFNLVIADLKEELGKVRWGGVKLGSGRVYSLAYADDIVLLAEEEGEMKSIIERLEMYLEKKGLELNVEKTKVMRFRKGGGRMAKDWRWRGKEDRGSEGVQISGVCGSKKRWAGSICKRKN